MQPTPLGEAMAKAEAKSKELQAAADAAAAHYAENPTPQAAASAAAAEDVLMEHINNVNIAEATRNAAIKDAQATPGVGPVMAKIEQVVGDTQDVQAAVEEVTAILEARRARLQAIDNAYIAALQQLGD